LEGLRVEAAEPDLWSDQDRALEVTRKLARYEETVNRVGRLSGSLDDAEVLLDMAEEEGDAGVVAEVSSDLARVDSDLTLLERESLFIGEHDDQAAILSVHAGAGGVDAADWADMLLRMYLRFLERRGFQVEVDEIQPAEEAGVRSATITVRGEHAYGILESERGVHRLVRISPFDSAARRHTSSGSRPSAHKGPAGSTSTPPIPLFASPTCRLGWSVPVRRSDPNCRTATGRWRCWPPAWPSGSGGSDWPG
jgi:peptide chain release factor 2